MEPPSILLVEDNDAHALFIQNCLRKAGVSNPIVRFSDGHEALHFLSERSADERRACVGLVLLDLHLPNVGGLDVLRAIRLEPDMARVPVVMLTASDEDADILNCTRLGANSYVIKPPDFGEFVSRVRSIGAYWLQVDQLARRNGA